MTKTSKPTAASRRSSRGPRRPKPLPAHEAALVAFAELAAKRRLRWYVFGAQAVNFHGFPRATADLDVTIELATNDLPAFVKHLERGGFQPRFPDLAFILASRVIPVVHVASGLPIDLVLAGSGLEERFLDEVDVVRLGRRKIPVLSRENLVVTKVLAGRPKDLEDIRELVARHENLEVSRIEALLREIEYAIDERDLIPRFRSCLPPKR